MLKIKKLLLTSLILFGVSCNTTYQLSKPNFIYDSITIEVCVDIKLTRQPNKEALEFLKKRLSEHNICKQENIIFLPIRSVKQVPEMGVWDKNSIVSTKTATRKVIDPNSSDKHIFIYLLYAQGEYIDGKLNHLAGLNTGEIIVLFLDRTISEMEGAVLLHEFGHYMGMVAYKERQITPANPDRPTHCNNPVCVMFWTITVKNADFDSDCLKEIEALRNKS